MFKNLFKRKKKNLYDESFEQNSLETTGENPNKPIRKMSRKKKIAIAVTSIFLVIAIAVSSFAFSLFYVKKDYETVASFTNMPAPIQEETTGGITKKVDDYTVNIEFKAKYTLVGKVVEKHHYFPYKIANKLSQYDIGMAWGVMSDDTYNDHISYKNNGLRFLNYRYTNKLVEMLGGKEFLNSISNNHMIHANNHVLKLLRNVKEGQYIKIEGYLSYVSYKNKRYTGTWNSSLSRTDHGDGACEVIYVTNITWLKTK